MVIVGIDTQLVGIRPVHLPVRRQVISRVPFKCLFLVCVGKKQKLSPILIGQYFFCRWYWRLRGHWSIAGKDALVKKVFRLALNGELEITIGESIGDSPLERDGQLVHSSNFHHALYLLPWHKAQLHRSNDPEEAVAAVDQPEKLRVLGAATYAGSPGRIYQHEGFDVADKGLHLEAASMRIRRNRSSDRESICASLFLGDSPRRTILGL